MTQNIILIVITAISLGAFLNSWISRMRLELLENHIKGRLEQRVKQLHAMQYAVMRKQGWTHEELSEAFPVIND